MEAFSYKKLPDCDWDPDVTFKIMIQSFFFD